ncbi:MAG: LytR/AlgR family response regulator transcription factor [Monoglobales bacterium]
MYKLAFCDDNVEFMTHIVESVIAYGSRHGIAFDIQKYVDSDSLMEQIEEKKISDVYFLDIDMPNFTGLDLARMIRTRSDLALIVFITAYDSYAVDACGMNVVRYILKNRMENDIDNVLDELMIRLDRIHSDKIYMIVNQRKYLKIMQRDIVYAYKEQKNTFFVMMDGSKENDRITLQEAYEKLNNPDMIWLDRGIILNRYHISKITSENVIMDGGHVISAGDGRIKELKRILSEYWRDIL